MIGTGTIINCAAIVAGGVVGHFTGKLFRQEQQALQGDTFIKAASYRSTSWPASSAPARNDAASRAVTPFFLGLPVSIKIFMVIPPLFFLLLYPNRAGKSTAAVRRFSYSRLCRHRIGKSDMIRGNRL